MKVMLAHTFDVEKHNVAGWLASEKLDGVRAIWDGEQFLTRSGRTINAPTELLEGMPSEKLDGELWMGRGRFSKLSGIVRRIDPDPVLWDEIRYIVFDFHGPSETESTSGRLSSSREATFEERHRKLLELSEDWPQWVLPIRQEVLEASDDVAEKLRLTERSGGEGLMLRAPWSKWEPRRSKFLLKVKSFKDADATVIGHAEGRGKHEGRLGALVCKLDDGKEFRVGTGFSDYDRENPPKVGDRIIFSFFELSSYGIPRFPAFLGVRGE